MNGLFLHFDFEADRFAISGVINMISTKHQYDQTLRSFIN